MNKQIIATVLALSMLITVASCDKTSEETEAETAASETTVTETAAETTVETTAEETEETEETEPAPTFEEQEFDADEYPFEINMDTFIEASTEAGGTVYYDVDEYVSFMNDVLAYNVNAYERYEDGVAIITDLEGALAIEEALSGSSDDAIDVFDDLDDHIINECRFSANDPDQGGYQFLVVYYETDDPQAISDWYAYTAAMYMEDIPSSNPDPETFSVSVNAYRGGDARALLSSVVMTESAVRDSGYPEHLCAYIGLYAQGPSGLFITVTDFSDDQTAVSMLSDFCDTMGILNPATYAAAE